MKYYCRAFVVLFLLGACNNAPIRSSQLTTSSPSSQQPEVNTRQDTAPGTAVYYVDTADHKEEEQASTIQLELLDGIPEQIDGCARLYTYDSIPLQAQQYLFVSNLQELAFVKINGRQIMLERLEQEQLSGGAYRYTYEGGGYKVILHIKAAKQTGEEVFYDTGTLEVWQEEKKVSVEVHGESGC